MPFPAVILDRRRTLLGAGALALTAAPAAAQAPDAALERAFFYAFPLYEFARIAQERSMAVDGRPGLLNSIAHRAALADHTSRQVTAPNNDTVYSSAFLELSSGPVEVVSPTDTQRYFSIAMMDAFTDNFAYIGTRATKGQGGRFLVAGPTWRGRAPRGVKLFRSSTNDVWLLARVLVDGPQDLAAAQVLQRQIEVRPASPDVRGRPWTVRARSVEDPENFLAVVNEVLARSPGGRGHTARARAFATLGVGPGVTPTPAQLAAWRAFIPRGLETLRNRFQFRDNVIDGWSYQEKGVGDFGTDDRLRATTALGGLAALGEEEAMYFHATMGPDGQRLSGAHRYRWTVPPGGVPADAFWSLTMYQAEPDGRYFFTQNPINRFAIGDRTPGLVKNADGSFDILIQRDRPDGPMAANWLPAPAGPLRLALRAYLPKPELRARRWRVPPLVQVS